MDSKNHMEDKMKKRNVFLFIGVCVTLVILLIGVHVIQEEKRQEQIVAYLAESENFYVKFDFDNVEKCYDMLDNLNYDTSKRREILDYDKKVYPDAFAYYTAINKLNDSLHSGSYPSLSKLIENMTIPTQKFELLEINDESMIGQYIKSVKSNPMFSIFNEEYIYENKYNLDYGLTSWGFAYVIETYTEILADEQFPYLQ